MEKASDGDGDRSEPKPMRSSPGWPELLLLLALVALVSGGYGCWGWRSKP